MAKINKRIDLNSDLGEGFGPWKMGDDKAMLAVVTSANIACGGHASDPETMFKTLSLAVKNGVNVGAHPGYNDREGFGRRVIPMAPAEVGRLIVAQIGSLQALAKLAGTKVSYVKAHGALANLAARDADVAEAMVQAIQDLDPDLTILAISGTQVERIAKVKGQRVYSEIFADRGYLSSGHLVPRGEKGAMIHDPSEAADRLLHMLETGLMPVIDGDPIKLDAHSICVHGDSAGAVAMAQELRQKLGDAGISIRNFLDT
ncbi:MAG TPA: LamB/YcsF family protein [Rhodobacteraceae bacterium]|nr:LamB/YcsF family protein [Amylibacter sp.]MDG1237228.1 LamB/YcsF family protein [Amylibacter sp.]MDG1998953.1 LamB/YcsF family protein [Amylibacter sp.]HAD29666.1 LamB/YcsF family protein [Paracoccaceae bacterium]|tara:strand:+ start:1543 stop:2319 length:777 start_codon:yes stop_codon:yes gene_type:complete